MRYIITCILFITVLFAQTIFPYKSIKASGDVYDLVLKNNRIVVGTSKGSLEAYNINTDELLIKSTFEKIKDFMGDTMYPKIFSVDYMPNQNKYLAVVQTTSGYRELVIIKDNVRHKIIFAKDKLYLVKARFLTDNLVVLALLSNEIILYDLEKNKQIYKIQISQSRFSDFAMNEDKTLLADACESGEITILNINNGKVKKVLNSAHVSNIYKVDFKMNKILSAGEDRRAVVYDLKTDSYIRHDSSFFIYAGGLSPSGKKAAFSFNEYEDIYVYDLNLNKHIYTLSGQKGSLNIIVFKNENELISSSENKNIMFWKLN